MLTDAVAKATLASSVSGLAGSWVWAAGSDFHSKLCEYSKKLKFGPLNLNTIRKKDGKVVKTLTGRRIDPCAVQEKWWGGEKQDANQKGLTLHVLPERQQRGNGWCWQPTAWMLGGECIWRGSHLRLNQTSNWQQHLYHHICLCTPVWPSQCGKGQLLWRAPSSSSLFFSRFPFS